MASVTAGEFPNRRARRTRIRRALLVLFMALVIPETAAAQVTEETPESLPEGKGRDETFYGCTACHGTAIIRQQGMTRERWDETMRVMTEKHGMTPYEGELRELILDYLSTTFPPRRRAPDNPFLSP
jgi:hypothetical protein